MVKVYLMEIARILRKTQVMALEKTQIKIVENYLGPNGYSPSGVQLGRRVLGGDHLYFK